jgi:hypothetical protein
MSANSTSPGQKIRETRQLASDIITSFQKIPILTPTIVKKYTELFKGVSAQLHKSDLVTDAERVDKYKLGIEILSDIQELLEQREKARISGESTESCDKQLSNLFRASVIRSIKIEKIYNVVIAEKKDYHAYIMTKRELSALPERKQQII